MRAEIERETSVFQRDNPIGDSSIKSMLIAALAPRSHYIWGFPFAHFLHIVL